MPKKGMYKLDTVAIRMVEEPPLYSSRPIESPEDVIRLMAETLRQYDREVLCIVNFRNDHSPINMNIVSMGTLNASLAHPREILKSPILSNAAAVMLVHNHPSGNLTLSKDDIEITERMQKLFSLADIQFLDHIIVGNRGEYFSFLENNILPDPEDASQEDRFGTILTGPSVQEAATKREDRIREITDRLEAGLQELFSSDKYKAYLATMAKFHNYSLNNTLLIAMQKPDATLVAGYLSP